MLKSPIIQLAIFTSQVIGCKWYNLKKFGRPNGQGGKHMKNKYIQEYERYQIEVSLKEKTPVRKIAELLGKCVKTIYNEIKLGTITQIDSNLKEYTIYQADVAQRRHDENCRRKGVRIKMNNDSDFSQYVEHMILNEHYSPYAVLCQISIDNLRFKTSVCFKTLYNYIHKGLFCNVSIHTLPMPRKTRKKGKIQRHRGYKSIKGKSIEQRPKESNERAEYGHWEMDSVVSGRFGTGGLLVLTERMTRDEYVFHMKSVSSDEVVRNIDSLERALSTEAFKEKFKTITCDNGSEFLDFTRIEQSCINRDMTRTQVYYCHPYSSYERGSNENGNKLIRRWFPKGCDISKYDEDFTEYVQLWMNDYPRKIFGGISANMYKASLGVS